MSKSFAYDEAPSITPQSWDLPEFTGSAAASQKFVAFNAQTLKAVYLKPTVAGTSNDVCSLITISGTSTTTTALGTIGSGVTALQSYPVGTGNTPAGVALSAGDLAYVVKGTDGTAKYAGQIEIVPQNGALFSS